MGGVVARSVYLQPDFDLRTVAFHVELASPSYRPVVYLDRGLWEFYEQLNEVWSQVGHVLPPVLSIMGGERDLQVSVPTSILKILQCTKPRQVGCKSYEQN